MYSLVRYSHMIADTVRTSTHLRALEATLKPGMTVVDLGAGSGIFSLMACRLGASKVYAIDTAHAVQDGIELARANGFESRIEWIQKDSKKVTLPEQADLMITDLRGCLPFIGNNLSVLADARDRFLKPGGILLPDQDQLWIAIADAPDDYQKAACPWGENDFGFDLSPLMHRHTHSWISGKAENSQHLSKPEKWTTLDYKTLSYSNVDEKITSTIQRDATAHGFYLWFDAEIHPGIGFSGAGGPNSPSVYGSAFFPWSEPVQVKKGNQVCIHLEARLVSGDYFWRWRTEILSSKNDAQTRRSFDQSTFHAESPSLTQLKKRAHSHIPQLSDNGQIQAKTLQLMDGNRSLETIAKNLTQQFPEHFPNYAQALAFTGNVSEKHSL